MDTEKSPFTLSAHSSLSHLPSYRSVASDEIEVPHHLENGRPFKSHSDARTQPQIRHLSNPEVVHTKAWSGLKGISLYQDLRPLVMDLFPPVIICALLSLIIFMSLYGPLVKPRASFNHCAADGKFSVDFADFQSYTPWKREALFVINLGFGSYSFTMAKLIDVSWDVVSARISSRQG